MCSAVNLLLTVVFLKLYHQRPPSPVPKRLRYFVFKVVAPVTFYTRTTNVIQNEEKVQPACVEPKYVKETSDVSTEYGKENQEHPEDIMSQKPKEKFSPMQEEFDTEYNDEEWQIISRILDRFLFMLNVFAMSTALGYGYITLYTH